MLKDSGGVCEMSLLVCGICKMNTLDTDGKCQHCGQPFKKTIWKRNLRKREACGALLIAIGFALIQWFRGIGFLLVLLGAALIFYGFLHPRIQY